MVVGSSPTVGVIFAKQPTHPVTISEQNILAEPGFDPGTFGLWAQHAASAPPRLRAPTRIRTGVSGFKVLSDNLYTIGANNIVPARGIEPRSRP